MAITNKVLVCSVFIFCIGFAASKVAEDNELKKNDSGENVVEDDDEATSWDNDDIDDDLMRRIISFVEAYKRTAKVVEEGMERINKHVAVASKQIGKEIVETFQKMKRNREEL